MKCKKHPKYKAKMKPRVPCEECWCKWFWVKYASIQASS